MSHTTITSVDGELLCSMDSETGECIIGDGLIVTTSAEPPMFSDIDGKIYFKVFKEN